MTSHTQLLVYNSENRFVGSFYHTTCRVKRIKRFFEKSVFWDRLIDNISSRFPLKNNIIFGTWHFLLKLQTISWKSWHRLDTTWKRRQGFCKELDEKINLAVFALISGFPDFSRQWCFSWIRVTLNILYVAHAVDCFNCFFQNLKESYKRAGWKLVFVEDQFMSDWNW